MHKRIGWCRTPNPKWVSVEVEWTKAVQETLGSETQESQHCIINVHLLLIKM